MHARNDLPVRKYLLLCRSSRAERRTGQPLACICWPPNYSPHPAKGKKKKKTTSHII